MEISGFCLVSNVVGWLQRTEKAGLGSVWLARKKMMGDEEVGSW